MEEARKAAAQFSRFINQRSLNVRHSQTYIIWGSRDQTRNEM